MTDEEIKALQDENKSLKRQVLEQTIARLRMEMMGAQASMAAIQLRAPQIEMELSLAEAKLKELGNGN